MALNGLSRNLDFVLWAAQVTNEGFLEGQLCKQIVLVGFFFFFSRNITQFSVWRMIGSWKTGGLEAS